MRRKSRFWNSLSSLFLTYFIHHFPLQIQQEKITPALSDIFTALQIAPFLNICRPTSPLRQYLLQHRNVREAEIQYLQKRSQQRKAYVWFKLKGKLNEKVSSDTPRDADGVIGASGIVQVDREMRKGVLFFSYRFHKKKISFSFPRRGNSETLVDIFFFQSKSRGKQKFH